MEPRHKQLDHTGKLACTRMATGPVVAGMVMLRKLALVLLHTDAATSSSCYRKRFLLPCIVITRKENF
jgi:hypothetical protein